MCRRIETGVDADVPARILHTGIGSGDFGKAKGGMGCLRNSRLGGQYGYSVSIRFYVHQTHKTLGWNYFSSLNGMQYNGVDFIDSATEQRPPTNKTQFSNEDVVLDTRNVSILSYLNL